MQVCLIGRLVSNTAFILLYNSLYNSECCYVRTGIIVIVVCEAKPPAPVESRCKAKLRKTSFLINNVEYNSLA